MSVCESLLLSDIQHSVMEEDQLWRDKEVLKRLYNDESLSAQDISDELDCGRRTVTNWLYKHGLKEPSGNKPYHNRNKIKRLYVDQGLTSEEIADQFGCSHLTIERWVTRHDLSGQRARKGGDHPWRDEERLRELYCGLGLTNREIGNILDCSGFCVSRWLKSKNIEIKNPKYRNWDEIIRLRDSGGLSVEELSDELDVPIETIERQHSRYQDEVVNDGIPSHHKSPSTDAPWHDADKLRDLYKDQGKTTAEIADEFGCSESTVQRWLESFGIESSEDKPWTDKELLEKLHSDEGLNSQEIAEQLGCGHTTILRWKDNFGIGEDEKPPLWHYEGILRSLYVENNWSLQEIADELGAHKGTIRSWLRRHNIETPGRGGGKYQDETVLRRLYKQQEMSVIEVADELDCSHGTISYWLARHDIPTRTRDDVTHRFDGVEVKDEPPYENKQVLEQLYLDEGMSVTEIARELDFSEGVIRDRIHQFDLFHQKENKFHLEQLDYDIPDDVPWRDETLMRALYVDHDLSTNKISDVLNCSSATVCTWLDNHNIDTGNNLNRPSSFELEKMYVDDNKSGMKIARELEVSKSTVYRWLREADIEIRDPNDYLNPVLKDEERMREIYIENELSVQALSRKLDSSPDTIKRSLKNHGIERRSQSAEISGEKHPFWKGGQQPYGEGWTNQKRQTVLERDNYYCQSCGESQEEHVEKTEQGLHIRHIMSASEFDDPKKRNKKSNLVAMCSSCHKNWEGIPIRPHLSSLE